MRDLVIAVFNERFEAEEVRLDLLKRQHEHLIDLEDAVVLIRDQKGKVKLSHVSHLTSAGALTGGFLGTIFGVMLLNPIFALAGLATGTVLGGISGSLSHAGINEEFMRDFAEHLQPGTSALCVLVTEHLDKVLEELKRFQAKILRTQVMLEAEAMLKEALTSSKP
jgi:uncharacterized membrane protein